MKKTTTKIIIAFILFIIALTITFPNEWINKVIYIISYAIIGLEIVWKAIKNIIKGKVFDEHFLMTIATIGAFAIGEFPEAVAVMLFYQNRGIIPKLCCKQIKKVNCKLNGYQTRFCKSKKKQSNNKSKSRRSKNRRKYYCKARRKNTFRWGYYRR